MAKDKSEIMKALRERRKAEAEEKGLVKVRIDLYCSPDNKKRILNAVKEAKQD